MPKEPTRETRRLSRFFQRNLDTVRNTNQVAEFNLSSYFPNPSGGKNIPEEVKKKKVKKKSLGPQFRGFDKTDVQKSEILTDEVKQTVITGENSVKDFEPFMGFGGDDVDRANNLCIRTRECISDLQDAPRTFQGFSIEERIEAKSVSSNLSDKCATIKSDIYKNIDRRILKSHIKESEESDEKASICLKYRLQGEKHNCALKLEDKTWQQNGIVHNGVFFKPKNGVKHGNMIAGIGQLDRETVILSQIQKLNQELQELRKAKYASSEDVKIIRSPFFQIKKELIITPFIPPKSPHHLIEEELYHDPWALLVATIFLNKTAARAARPYVFWFLEENPDPITVVGKKVEQLETYFGALGLQNIRAVQVWRMSHDFIYKQWTKVKELYGIGQYGEDAFRMFCLGDFSVEPKDRFLKIYKAWYQMEEKKARLLEMNTISN